MPGTGAKPYFADIPDVLPEDAPRASAPLSVETWSRLHREPDTRGRVRRRRWLALLTCIVWALAQLVALGIRPDLATLPVFYVLATIVLPFAFGVVVLAVALSRGRLGLGARPIVVASLAIASSVFVIVLSFALPEPAAASASGVHSLVHCANLALAWAALPLVAAALTLRRSFASSPAWRSALVGAAIGLGAAVAAQLRCPVPDSFHVASAHGGIVLLTALAGAFLLARSTRV